MIDGNQVDISPAPITQAGRVFVPLRGVFERLGASVVYDSGTINATGNGRTIALRIGSTQATVDGQPQQIDVAPFIIGASTYVPLRFISESLGATVNWDESSQTVSIDMAGQSSGNAYVPPQQNDQGGGEYDGGSGTYANYAPPPIPYYDQPEVPARNYIWQPGYWAWGPYGFFWVPGTWVAAPQPGYLWTPGYWAANDGAFAWHPGYWAVAVGFYGGVNYGAGYYGRGYEGGRWSGREFHYNTYVTRVNVTVVRNVYVDRSVHIYTTTHVSYNGGRGGVALRPTAVEQAVADRPHLPPTVVQRQHVQTAAQDRRLLATVNHDRPPVVVSVHPFTPAARPAGFVPVRPADRVTPPVAPGPGVRATPERRPGAVTEPGPTQRPIPERSTRPAPVDRPSREPRPEVLPSREPRPEVLPSREPRPEVLPSREPRPEVLPSREPRPELLPTERPVVHTAMPYRAPVDRTAPPLRPQPVERTAPPVRPPAPVEHVAPPVRTPRPAVRTAPPVRPPPVVRTPQPARPAVNPEPKKPEPADTAR